VIARVETQHKIPSQGRREPTVGADVCLHDFAFQWGGAERVFAELVRLSLPSKVGVLAGDTDLLQRHMPEREVKLLTPGIRTNLEARLAVPLLAKTLPSRKAVQGRVLCSSYSITRWLRSEAPRLIYCHAPMRQIWHGFSDYTMGLTAESLALRAFGAWLRSVDKAATQSHDYVVVPSARVADLVTGTYGTRPQAIVPPPVEDEYFQVRPAPREEHFVWVGRIVAPVKRLALLCRVFAASPRSRLFVIGDGRSRRAIEKQAPPNVSFLGWREPDDIRRLVSSAQALLLPSMEDFGLCAAEALALGTPIIVTQKAGISRWVQSGINGVIAPWEYEGYRNAVLSFPRMEMASQPEIRAQAMTFSRSQFQQSMHAAMKDLQWQN
jgi:glycosyltransferase involved in cell wall biosynthesis